MRIWRMFSETRPCYGRSTLSLRAAPTLLPPCQRTHAWSHDLILDWSSLRCTRHHSTGARPRHTAQCHVPRQRCKSSLVQVHVRSLQRVARSSMHDVARPPRIRRRSLHSRACLCFSSLRGCLVLRILPLLPLLLPPSPLSSPPPLPWSIGRQPQGLSIIKCSFGLWAARGGALPNPLGDSTWSC